MMVRYYNEDEIPAVYSIEDIPTEASGDGLKRRAFRGNDVFLGITTKEGDHQNLHTHPWEQVNYILEGKAEFFIGEETVIVEEGDFFVIPPGYEHCSGEIFESPYTALTINPVREDRLELTDYQTEYQRD